MATEAEITALRTKLTEAKAALHQVMLGDKTVQVGFGTNRLTQWNNVKPAELRIYIADLEGQLNAAIGQAGRGPIYPMSVPR